MVQRSESENLETYREDLRVYRQLEQWGCVLFLTAILVMTDRVLEPKLLVEFGLVTAQGVLLSIGIFGTVFLKVVNYRGRRAYAAVVGREKPWVLGGGVLGWMIAMMPIFLGLLMSLALEAVRY